jgi:hypothetical protein
MDLVTVLISVLPPVAIRSVAEQSSGASAAPTNRLGTADASAEPVPQGVNMDMPAGSSKKRERQYEHIKESYKDRGVSTDEAEERAARTVNKERRKAGETKEK